MTNAELDRLADRLAERVLDRLTGTHDAAALVDAAEVARRYGIARSTVYDNADRLGAIRLGSGSRARLRFDPERVARELLSDHAAVPTRLGTVREVAIRRPRQRDGHTTAGAPLLQVKDATP